MNGAYVQYQPTLRVMPCAQLQIWGDKTPPTRAI
jgi:hypothetical protein